MSCGKCGGKVKVDRTVYTGLYEDPTFDERQMVILDGDYELCEPYHGEFPGTYVWVVGRGTEHERFFLRSLQKQAEAYAAQNNVKVWRLVSVRNLCHDRVVTALGA